MWIVKTIASSLAALIIVVVSMRSTMPRSLDADRARTALVGFYAFHNYCLEFYPCASYCQVDPDITYGDCEYDGVPEDQCGVSHIIFSPCGFIAGCDVDGAAANAECGGQ